MIFNKNSRKRRLEKNPVALNDWFDGCAGHHINKKYIIYIPAEMHHSYHNQITGQGMEAMNKKAIAFLGDVSLHVKMILYCLE